MGQRDTSLDGYIRERVAAADIGQPDALYDLGLLYSTGQGVRQDYVAAHKWFNLAAMRGVRRAEVDRSELACDMTAKDVEEALRQARAWLDTH